MRILCFVACCVLVPTAAFAQLAQNTGAVSGTVTDGSGGAVPGAKVTVTSPALQGQETFLTNDQGNYRFPSLPVPGNQINAVIRTGSNQFHGEMYQDYENPSFQGANISQAQLLQGAGVGTRIDTYHDTNGNFGGPIKRDRIWFFVSLRSQVSSYGVVGFPVEKPGSQPFYAKDQNATYKITGNINSNHRLSNYIQWNPILKPWRGASSTNYLDSVYYQKAVAWVGNVQYSGNITPKLFVNVLLGTWGYNFPQVPYAGPDGKLAIRQTELASNNVAGSYPEVRSDPRRYQFEPTGSYFLDDFLHTNHQIKFGWITERETEDNEQYGPLGENAFTYNCGGQGNQPARARLPCHRGRAANGRMGTQEPGGMNFSARRPRWRIQASCARLDRLTIGPQVHNLPYWLRASSGL
ncbi:MAG TPA: carboxypeptidase-like regulatory domain-containing protein [Bryobacteraceae bacterium]|nr:carboxypeptidase-like regulatory domain-containing protein [Bryobacteraceae bacterium]